MGAGVSTIHPQQGDLQTAHPVSQATVSSESQNKSKSNTGISDLTSSRDRDGNSSNSKPQQQQLLGGSTPSIIKAARKMDAELGVEQINTGECKPPGTIRPLDIDEEGMLSITPSSPSPAHRSEQLSVPTPEDEFKGSISSRASANDPDRNVDDSTSNESSRQHNETDEEYISNTCACWPRRKKDTTPSTPSRQLPKLRRQDITVLDNLSFEEIGKMSHEHVLQLWSELDREGRGFIGRSELKELAHCIYERVFLALRESIQIQAGSQISRDEIAKQALEEIKYMLPVYSDEKPIVAMRNHVLKVMDENHDGQCSKEEFLSYWPIVAKQIFRPQRRTKCSIA